MTRYQNSIIWLGLILIALNVIVNIGSFKAVLFGGPSGNAGASASVKPPSNSNTNPSTPLAPPQLPVTQQTPPGVMTL